MLKKSIFVLLIISVFYTFPSEKQIKIKKITFNSIKVLVGIGTLLPASMVLDVYKDFYKEFFTNAKVINGVFFTSGICALAASIWCITDGALGIYNELLEQSEDQDTLYTKSELQNS